MQQKNTCYFLIIGVMLVLLWSSCVPGKPTGLLKNKHQLRLPSFLSGSFKDDYGIRYTINDTLWVQRPDVKYHILFIDTAAQYLLAQNDKQNPGEKGLYTRIDYMRFTNMGPYHWGYCLTVYNADTMEEAKNKAQADRTTPRKGCNGYPFSRMEQE